MKLICFDMDNTLIHSDRAHAEAFNGALYKMGYDKIPVRLIKSLFGRPKSEVSHILLGTKDKRKIKQALELHDFYLSKTSKYTTKVQGIVGLLKRLKKKYELAVVSNSSHRNILLLLKAAGIDKNLFDVVVGYDDVRHSKPYPDEIIKAEKLSHLDVKYMVGDSVYDIRAGRKARVKTIAVLTGNYSRKTLRHEKPNHIVKSVVDIERYL